MKDVLWIGLALVALMASGCAGNKSSVEDDTDALDTSTDSTTDLDSSATDTHTETGYDTDISPCLGVVNADLADADSQLLFDYDHVPTFDIFVPEEKWDNLIQNARDEEYTDVQLCFEGQRVGTVGLRFKGSYGTLYSCFDKSDAFICDRLSMKLKFDKYVDDQRLFGLKRLNFRSNMYDDTRMKERLVLDLYREMGITAPRASWAVVRVNGESLGLYGMVEQIDGRLTADRWPDYPDGNVYKELWPNDTDEALMLAALKTNGDEADVSRFSAFATAIANAAGNSERLITLGQYTDLDYWAKFMAVDDAVIGYDNVTYFFTDGVGAHNHNYYIAEDAKDHFTVIPWDVESSFWINPDHAAPHWTEVPADCSLKYPYWEGYAMAPACDSIFSALNTDLAPWREAARELLDGPFSEASMQARIEGYVAFMGAEARARKPPPSMAPSMIRLAGW